VLTPDESGADYADVLHPSDRQVFVVTNRGSSRCGWGKRERSCIEPLRLLVWRDAAACARRSQPDH